MNRLEQHVKDWIKDNSYDDYNPLDDLLQHGCQSGMVSHLIYYSDTVSFYTRYQVEINDLLSEMLEEIGVSINELFGDKWDSKDPLARDTFNQNLLAWFGFEETASRLSES